jgi:predicted nucleic acid-binding protein
VISELWKVKPDPGVLAWVDAQTVETLYLSAITVAELRFGLATMPEGKRRSIYQDRLEQEVLPAFMGRVLPFDLNASQAYADLMARAKAEGKADRQGGRLHRGHGLGAQLDGRNARRCAVPGGRPHRHQSVESVNKRKK